MYQFRSSVVGMMKTILIGFFTGAAFIPFLVSAIGFGGAGPVRPSQPPQLVSPFGSQHPHSPGGQQATQGSVYLCICDQTYCGNNAISGRYGQIEKDIAADELAPTYEPDRTGNKATGWVCRQQGMYRCECVAETRGDDTAEAVRVT